jgi:5-formyltetrahydrofolate cyclo-ligase
MLTSTPTDPQVLARRALRRGLLEARERFAAEPAAAAAFEALAGHLKRVLAQLEPDCLGLYWPMRSEFNAPAALVADALRMNWRLALPFTRRSPREMHYRAWNGTAPTLADECGIPASDGPQVAPDLVLAPCVGFTAEGYRLGYGGGYFDRWMAAHPHATAVGVALSAALLGGNDYAPQPHDRPLALVVTEHGVHPGPDAAPSPRPPGR